MKNCILSQDKKQYNPDNQFVVYIIETKSDQSRFLVLQYQNLGDENFTLVRLQSSTGMRFFDGDVNPNEHVYSRKTEIISREDLIKLLETAANRYQMEIVDKRYLERSLHIFEGIDYLRSASLAQTFKSLTDKLEAIIKVPLNPVELTLSALEKVGEKKVEGRCMIL